MPKKYKVKLDAVVGRYDELNVWRSRALAAEQRLSARQRSSPWRGSPCPSVDSWRERAVAAEQAERFPDASGTTSTRRAGGPTSGRRGPTRGGGGRAARARPPAGPAPTPPPTAEVVSPLTPATRSAAPTPTPTVPRRRAEAAKRARARPAWRELEAELEGLGADLAAIRAAARPPPPEKTAPAPPASARSPGEDAWAALIETGARRTRRAAPEPDHHRVHAKHTGHATGLHRRR
ncbi:hypothetical protein SO694_00015495 [Aureococcus anophagefferens]|uniref:Uncharacterized protein n=1 Tax=Aureococcus anophagefferens TaxID=44056 RepID=A0ABR1G375_AURAN